MLLEFLEGYVQGLHERFKGLGSLGLATFISFTITVANIIPNIIAVNAIIITTSITIIFL